MALRGRKRFELSLFVTGEIPLEAFQRSFVAVTAISVSPWSLG